MLLFRSGVRGAVHFLVFRVYQNWFRCRVLIDSRKLLCVYSVPYGVGGKYDYHHTLEVCLGGLVIHLDVWNCVHTGLPMHGFLRYDGSSIVFCFLDTSTFLLQDEERLFQIYPRADV